MLISIETHITFDFPGGQEPLFPPLAPHMQIQSAFRDYVTIFESP